MAKTSSAMKRSSAMGAGGNATVTENVAFSEFAVLNGTEKQVQYANDIREIMRNTIDRLNTINADSDRYDIASAGADISTIARQLGLDIGQIGREDLKSDRETSYKDMIASGFTSQQARKEAYAVDRESAFRLSAKQSASIKESGGTREERDNARKKARAANLIKSVSAIRKAASNAFRNQTEAKWWIDRK